ncbi:polyketide synthase [Xylariomycetidae sp. FL0641]|nr:polyketide synthase [Xylariomycetidae sp. FL0641]
MTVEQAAMETQGITRESHTGSPSGAPIAIVGLSCKFGGDATSPSKLWDLCTSAKDAWSPIPHERFDAAGLYDERKGKPGRHSVKGGYFLNDIALFDSAFYNYTTDVANAMDPQIRMLLESVYESVEDAGIPIEKLAGSNTSVFTGSFSTDYSDMTLRDPDTMQPSYKTGNGIAMLSNRISHFYDFQGPSMTIDVGCSTSLVALHQACQSLRSGESDVSIVGSSLICLSPDMFTAMTIAGVLGPNGKCFAWDERAEGYGRGEGVASLVLKPLAAALRDGDHVHAVVRETGVNQDGKTPTITSPSLEAQVKLIRDVYRRAGLDPTDTGYVEAHMTGTPTGDPIEAEALARTFGEGRRVDDPVLVGSVKPNIGHTEPVSGLAAIIKTVFALKNAVVPPNVNYKVTNPNIPLDRWRLKVPRTVMPWPVGKPRRASVNNFGYGGTNAHVILEAADSSHVHLPSRGHGMVDGTPELISGSFSDTAISALTNNADGVTQCDRNKNNGTSPGSTSSPGDPSLVYVITAKDSTTAQQMNINLADYIHERSLMGTEPSPVDLAFTLAERKSRFPWTTVVRARGLAELARRLREPGCKASRVTKKPRLGFVFNGQGAQWHAMGRELIQGYPVFRRSLLAADQILRDYGAQWSLSEEMLRDEKSTRVHEIALSQPITVALQLCLVDLLASWNITPSAVTSHSSGEIAAAYAVGALTFQQALGVVYFRGQLAHKHHEAATVPVLGGMLAAGLSAERAAAYIQDTKAGTVVVACHNSPESVTLSGDSAAIDEVAVRLTEDGIFARRLNVPLAYHSHHMTAMAQDYTDKLRKVVPSCPSWSGALFASPVTGDIVTSPKVLGAEHYVQNLVSPVLFAQALEQMCFSKTTSDGMEPSADEAANVDMIVEIGAHGTLSGPIRKILGDRHIPYVSCLQRYSDAVQTMQEAAAAVLSRGCPVSLASVNGHERGSYVAGLPTYPWNHTTPHWIESRLYREHRYKRFRPHELLGSPIAGTNPQIPVWRNFLRPEDVQWLRDHKLGADLVMPGAGYIAMAIEAVRLLADASEKSITGYHLRNIEILNALTVPETASGIEVQLMLRPCSEKELDYKEWYEFEVWSIASKGDTWIQHCTGGVSAETGSKTKEAATRVTMPAPTVDSFFTTDADVREVEPDSVFAGLRTMNIFHGPVFQNLIHSRVSLNQSITSLSVSPAAADIAQPYVLHPTTLDSLIQAAYVAIPDATQQGAMVVPRSIRHLYVPRPLHRQAGETLTTFVSLAKADRRGALVSAVAVNGAGDDAYASQLQMKGLYCQAVPLDGDSVQETRNASMCSQTRWELDITSGIPAVFKTALQIQLDETDVDFEKKLDRVAFNFITEAVKQLPVVSADCAIRPAHLHRFEAWMRSVVKRGQAGDLGTGSRLWSKTNPGLKQRLADDVAAENAAGKLVVRMGHQMGKILRGEVDPVALFQADGLLDQYYETLPRLQRRSYVQLGQMIAQYAAKQPGACVLEIGATGSATAHILRAFAAKGTSDETDGNALGTLLGHYDFTNTSTNHFKAARLKCAPWELRVSFKQLDILSDPVTQGFTTNSYDLIIAAGTTPTTPDLPRMLAHARSLLKPGGQMVLAETTRARLDTQVVFGGLPGSWHGKDETNPSLSLDDWNAVLRDTGFTGVDCEVADCEDMQFRASSVILTTAAKESAPPPAYPTLFSVVCTAGSLPSEMWLECLRTAIRTEMNAEMMVETLSQVQARDDVTYIFTAEMITPFLSTIDKTAFEKLKALMVHGQGLLWLSSSSTISAKEPLYAQSTGLLRTAKQEDSSRRYVSLDFESQAEEPWPLATIPHILRVLKQSFDARIDTADIEWEYAVQMDALHVPRVYPDPAQDRTSSDVPVEPVPSMEPLWQQNRPLVWETAQTSGTLSNLYFADDAEATKPDLPVGMVEIKTQAMGLNFRDVMCALGQIDESNYVHDAAGIVTRLGKGAETSGLRVGDRVCGVLNGRFATHPRAPWTSLAKIPDDVAWKDAASIPVVFLTSYICLFELARLQPGERVLIHAGSGGVGQSAIMLAQHVGAEVFTTCSSEEKRNLLMTQYGLDADHIFSSRDTSFAAAILARTGGEGIDVVINSLSGPLLKATWDCMSRFGRFVEIGKVDIEAARLLDLTPLTRSAMICGFDLTQECAFNGRRVARAWQAIMKLWSTKVIRAVHPVVTYPVRELETALRRMQRGSHIGKLVLLPGPDSEVKVLTRPNDTANLDDPNSTYLIAGGLGGIGYSLACWMMERGARHILIVSRSAESHPQAAPLMAHGKSRGCFVAVRNCDISREDKLVQLLADCAITMPPIRGVVQAAMALNDTILERLTFEQWQNGIGPKVAGSLHLHHHLPGLRFFVMLSSIAGVLGHASQANYAAGNTFQDALARHRTAAGLPAVSLDLGAVGDVGVVAEASDDMRERLERNLGSAAIPIARVLRLIEAAVCEPLRESLNDSQVITGIVDYEHIPAGTAIKRDRRFATLRLGTVTNAEGTSSTTVQRSPDDTLKQSLQGAGAAGAETLALVMGGLTARLATLFNLVAADINTAGSLSSLGVDSLVAVELRNWLSTVLQAKVTVFEILQSATLIEFARLVMGRSALIS